MDTVYPDKSAGTIYAFTKTDVLARGRTCLRNLYNRPEKVIAVVSHSGFLRTAISQTRYGNADFRIFSFREAGHDGTAATLDEVELIEDDSTAGEGGMGWSEAGRAELQPWDFPSEGFEKDEVIAEKVDQKFDSRTSKEAANEVPK